MSNFAVINDRLFENVILGYLKFLALVCITLEFIYEFGKGLFEKGID